MAREKFQTLTEQMFYVLLCLREECCGMDLMERIRLLTSGRVSVGPGTLYNLLEQFAAEGYIVETKCEGRRRSYVLTEKGDTTSDGWPLTAASSTPPTRRRSKRPSSAPTPFWVRRCWKICPSIRMSRW